VSRRDSRDPYPFIWWNISQSYRTRIITRGSEFPRSVRRPKEMLLPIEGKRAAEKKKAAKPERSAGRRKAG
jgi:hypothetical protein